jgi:hypothetical protein
MLRAAAVAFTRHEKIDKFCSSNRRIAKPCHLHGGRARNKKRSGRFGSPAVDPQEDEQLHCIDALRRLYCVSRLKHVQTTAAHPTVALLKLVADVFHAHLQRMMSTLQDVL